MLGSIQQDFNTGKTTRKTSTGYKCTIFFMFWIIRPVRRPTNKHFIKLYSHLKQIILCFVDLLESNFAISVIWLMTLLKSSIYVNTQWFSVYLNCYRVIFLIINCLNTFLNFHQGFGSRNESMSILYICCPKIVEIINNVNIFNIFRV